MATFTSDNPLVLAKRTSSTIDKNGSESAVNLVSTIIGTANDLKQTELENLCKLCLSAAKQTDVLAQHENKKNTKVVVKVVEKDISTTRSWISGARSWISGTSSSAANNNTTSSIPAESTSNDTEESISRFPVDIQKAPITEICVVQRGEQVPEGFTLIKHTPGHKKANLNHDSGGNHLYFCVKKETRKDVIPITALAVIFPDQSEAVPPGFYVARHGKSPCNLNSGTSADRIFLCYKKEKTGNPIIDINVLFTHKGGDEIPKSFYLLDKTPTNRPANLNSGTSGGPIFISYRQLLLRLDCLLSDETKVYPLLQSITSARQYLLTGGVSPRGRQSLGSYEPNSSASLHIGEDKNTPGTLVKSGSLISSTRRLTTGGLPTNSGTSPIITSPLSLASQAPIDISSANAMGSSVFNVIPPIAGVGVEFGDGSEHSVGSRDKDRDNANGEATSDDEVAGKKMHVGEYK